MHKDLYEGDEEKEEKKQEKKKKKQREEIMKKFLRKGTLFVEAPKLNPEIFAYMLKIAIVTVAKSISLILKLTFPAPL